MLAGMSTRSLNSTSAVPGCRKSVLADHRRRGGPGNSMSFVSEFSKLLASVDRIAAEYRSREPCASTRIGAPCSIGPEAVRGCQVRPASRRRSADRRATSEQPTDAPVRWGSMKAAVRTTYGPPEVVRLTEVPTPEPGHGEMLVHVRATTVNRTDRGYRAGKPFIIRFFSGLIQPKVQVLGTELFAGTVEASGDNVTSFAPGDRVFGYNERTFGAHAQYMTIPEHGSVRDHPGRLDLRGARAEPRGFALCPCRPPGGQGRRRQRRAHLRRNRRDRFGCGAAGKVPWSDRDRGLRGEHVALVESLGATA